VMSPARHRCERQRILWPLAAALAMVVSLSACSSSSDSSTDTTVGALQKTYPPQVALFGDSLAWEAERYYSALVEVTGETALTFNSRGGSAICDWLSTMRDVAANDGPNAVQLEFSGNALTDCMTGYVAGTPAYYQKYRDDTLTAIEIFAATGAHIFLVGAPINRAQSQSDPTWDTLNKQYAEIAAADPARVTYVDAGAAVEGPDHTYTDTLPCLPVEPCTGPVVDGTPSNIVRAPDGGHFCPVANGDENGEVDECPVYSSGAFRYAYTMYSAIGVPNAQPARGRR